MYYLIYFVGFISSLYKEKNKMILWLFFFLILLLALFRFGVGADYFAYEFLYSRVNSNPLTEIVSGRDQQEVLFRLIGSLFNSFGIPYEIYIGVFSITILIFTYKLCLKYSKTPIQSLFLYYSFFYFVWTFSGIRQGLVISIGMYYLIECIEKKKTIKIIVIVALLSLIHVSALYILVLYIANHIKFNRKRVSILIVSSLLFSFLPLSKVVGYLATHFILFNRVMPYLNESINLYDFSYIVRFLLLVFGILFYDLFQDYKTDRIIMNTFIIGLSSYFVFSFSELTAARLSIYGYYYIILIIPQVLEFLKKYSKDFVIVILLFIGSFVYINKELNAMKNQSGLLLNHAYVPYTNLFERDRDVIFNNNYYDILYSDKCD